MDWERKSIRLGAAVICCAVLIRLFTGGAGTKLVSKLTGPKVMSTLLFLETGRVVRESVSTFPTTIPTTVPTTLPSQTEPTPAATQPPTVATQPEVFPVPVFSGEDARLVQVNNVCGYETDVASSLLSPLSWDLTGEAPTVLIVHSHGTESYENTENYTESSPYRSKDVSYNVVSVGDRIVQVLEAAGIRAVHDRQLHDSPSYSSAYNNSRTSIQDYLARYPSIRLVLDIHRDAVEDGEGNQLGFTAQTPQGTAAQLMLVVGSDASGLQHPDWPENMSLAVKLHAQLERLAPGICRPISFRSQRFNQDLSPGALIVEVGSAGNTRQEALLAADILGAAILELSHGTGK